MENLNSLLTPGAKALRGYAEKLLVGIRPDQFARKPAPGGAAIELNHPAFNYGHLGLYPAPVLELLGMDNTRFRSPHNYSDLFKNGSPCHDDPEGKVYPAMETLTSQYFKGYDGLIELLPEIPEKNLSTPIGGERGTRFPTVGSFLLYLLTAHIGTHLGQVSAWRRCMGLKAA